jgi:hypothetical protein
VGPGQSDVDFVATLSRRPTGADVGALQSSHAEISAGHGDRAFDGMHVWVEDLAGDPEDCPDVPRVPHGLFEPEAREDLNPVAWHELVQVGLTVRGTGLADLVVWTRQRLVELTRDNVDSHWRPNAEALEAMPREAEAGDTCCWCVPGVARLHHLLVAGALTTKSGAGRWALSYYEERFHRVVREALRVRGPRTRRARR